MTRASTIVLATALASSGCGEIRTLSADGGGDQGDGGGQLDAGNPGDPLEGTWTWWIGSEADPDTTCEVTLGGGAYEVYCPSDPYEIRTDCMRTKSDTRIQGTWTASFDGTFDEITRYEGTACEPDYSPVGVDIVEQGVLEMDATHATTSEAIGFLQLAYGGWDWTIHEAEAPADVFGCTVSFAPADSGDAVDFHVECSEDPSTPKPDCTRTSTTYLEGRLDAAVMSGEGWTVDRYEGTGCAPDYPDPVVEQDHVAMGATRH
jgi:hypothetical protein